MDEFASELEDRRRHRRGEEKRLARLRELRDYAPDVREEAHVEHAVCFVENEAFNLVEIEYSLVHQVYEPPRARDDSLRALLDVLDLPVLADAPDEARERQLRVLRVALHVLRGLHGEFARRREDERARVADAARLPHPHEVVQDRQHERRRLACSRLRAADQVAPVEKIGNRLFLYRRRRLVAGVLYRVLQLLVEPPEYRVLKHIRLCLRVAPSDFVRTEERLLEIVPADKALVRVVFVLAYAARFREVEHHLAYVLARLEPPLRKDAVGERPELVERSLAELVHYFFRVGVSAVLRKVVDNIHQKRIGAAVIAVVLRHDVFKSVCLEVDLFHDAYYTKCAGGQDTNARTSSLPM